MTTFLPTVLVDVLRGETTDGYGDPVDTATAVATNIPVSIIEQSKRVWLPAESRFGVVRVFTGRARPDVDVREGDRLRAGASIYLVEGVSQPANPVGAVNVRLDLRRIDQ